MKSFRTDLQDVLSLYHVEQFILSEVEVSTRSALLRIYLFHDERGAGRFSRQNFIGRGAYTDATRLALAVGPSQDNNGLGCWGGIYCLREQTSTGVDAATLRKERRRVLAMHASADFGTNLKHRHIDQLAGGTSCRSYHKPQGLVSRAIRKLGECDNPT